MGVLTADVILPYKGHPLKFSHSANGADEFYMGALLYGDALGGCQVVPASGDHFLGIVAYHQTITAAGQEIDYFKDGTVLFPPCAGVTGADQGKALVMDISAAQSDNPADCVDETAAVIVAGDILIGCIEKVVLAVTTSEPKLGVWVTLHKPGRDWVALLGWGG